MARSAELSGKALEFGTSGKPPRGPSKWEKLAAEAKYNTEAFARACHVSTRHLRRQCWRYAEMPLREWLGKQRILEAQRRLSAGQIPKQFVGDLGFGHTRDFYEFFKRRTGLTTVEFVHVLKASQPLPGENFAD
jgi:methylphosphotriester-DNA--protein-cysteine methyltransferase